VQTQISFGLHAVVSVVVALGAAVVVWKSNQSDRSLDLVDRKLTWITGLQWVALVAAYAFMGFDLPFLILHRWFALSQFIIEHWLSFIPLSLLLTVVVVSSAMLLYHPARRTELLRGS
jgi:hypothetical protein